jgi:hypothetical protein
MDFEVNTVEMNIVQRKSEYFDCFGIRYNLTNLAMAIKCSYIGSNL